MAEPVVVMGGASVVPVVMGGVVGTSVLVTTASVVVGLVEVAMDVDISLVDVFTSSVVIGIIIVVVSFTLVTTGTSVVVALTGTSLDVGFASVPPEYAVGIMPDPPDPEPSVVGICSVVVTPKFVVELISVIPEPPEAAVVGFVSVDWPPEPAVVGNVSPEAAVVGFALVD